MWERGEKGGECAAEAQLLTPQCGRSHWPMGAQNYGINFFH